MKTESIKALLDACYQAKRIRELLPALPDGVSPLFNISTSSSICSAETCASRYRISATR